MKSILVFTILLFSLTSIAGVCDTLGFKVNVPKISKTDDRAVGIKITFDTTKENKTQKITIKNEIGQAVAGATISIMQGYREVDTLNLLADENGETIINNFLKNRVYTITISSIGYKTENRELSFSDSNTQNVILRQQYLSYDPVVVSSNEIMCRKITCRCFMKAITSYAYMPGERVKKEYYRLYPNPVRQWSQITVELAVQKAGNVTIQFCNFSGQIVFQKRLNPGTNINRIQLPNLAAGIYEVVIFDNLSQKKFTGKLLVL
jgi:hypothetical protein